MFIQNTPRFCHIRIGLVQNLVQVWHETVTVIKIQAFKLTHACRTSGDITYRLLLAPVPPWPPAASTIDNIGYNYPNSLSYQTCGQPNGFGQVIPVAEVTVWNCIGLLSLQHFEDVSQSHCFMCDIALLMFFCGFMVEGIFDRILGFGCVWYHSKTYFRFTKYCSQLHCYSSYNFVIMTL